MDSRGIRKGFLLAKGCKKQRRKESVDNGSSKTSSQASPRSSEDCASGARNSGVDDVVGLEKRVGKAACKSSSALLDVEESADVTPGSFLWTSSEGKDHACASASKGSKAPTSALKLLHESDADISRNSTSDVKNQVEFDTSSDLSFSAISFRPRQHQSVAMDNLMPSTRVNNSNTPIITVMQHRTVEDKKRGGLGLVSSKSTINATSSDTQYDAAEPKFDDPSDFQRFHAILARTLKSVAQNHQSPPRVQHATSSDLLADFLENNMTKDSRYWAWCWQTCVENPKKRAFRLLGFQLLLSSNKAGLSSFQNLLQPTESTNDRRRALQCIEWLEYVLLDGLLQEDTGDGVNACDRSSRMRIIQTLMDHVLPCLVAIPAGAPDRSVLAQKALNVATLLVAACCENLTIVTSSSNAANLEQEKQQYHDLVVRSGRNLDQIWDVQLSWLDQQESRDGGAPVSSMGDSCSREKERVHLLFGEVQRRCRRDVLLDWKRCHSQLLFGTGSDSAEEEWCVELCGYYHYDTQERGGVHGLGGLAQTAGLSAGKVTPRLIHAALILLQERSDGIRGRDVTIAFRGLLAWLGQRKKHMQMNDDSVCALLPVVKDLSYLLDSPAVFSLAASVIEILLCSSLGLLSGDYVRPPTNPNQILDQFYDSCMSKEVVDGRRVALIGNVIIMCGEAAVFRSLLTRREEPSVVILAYVIRPDRELTLALENSLRDAAAVLLCSKFGEWTSVRRVMKEDPELFVDCEFSSIVYVLVHLALKQLALDAQDSTGVSVIAESLVALLKQHSGTNDECRTIVSKLVECLIEQDDRATKFCDMIGRLWRVSLLEASPASFALVLTEIAQEMFRHPSRLVPLALFGAVIGGSADYTCHDDPIFMAVAGLLKLSVPRLSSTDLPSMDVQLVDAKLQRLSPLLLLRRVPLYFFWTLSSSHADADLRSEMCVLLESLAEQISIRLGIGESVVQFTSEERRLAAEVGALVLPFETLYRTIVLPSFSKLLGSLEISDPFAPVIVSRIRSARAALYSVCHVVSSARHDTNGLVLLRILSLILSILRYDGSLFTSKDYQEEYLQLQTGCIDFLALCVQRLINSCSVDGIMTTETVILCSSVMPESRCDLVDALKVVYFALKEIVCTGREVTVTRLVGNNQPTEEEVDYTFTSQTCIWNSFLLVAKRCQLENGYLGTFFRSVLPWVIDWGVRRSKDDSIRHALCIAAALQVVLNTSTRLASSPRWICTALDKTFLEKALRWSLACVRSNGLNGSKRAVSEARVSALKLLLFLVTVDSSTEDHQRLISQNQLFEILGLLESIADYDHDTELQKLAKRVVEVLGGTSKLCS